MERKKEQAKQTHTTKRKKAKQTIKKKTSKYRLEQKEEKKQKHLQKRKISKKKRRSRKVQITKKCHKKKGIVKRILRDLVIAGTIGTALVLLFLSFFLNMTTVKGFSMMPTVRDGERVLVEKKAEVKRFDVIVFSRGNREVAVCRLIGFPGERIRYDKDTLLVNDEPITEKFIVDAINESQKNGKDFTEEFNIEGSTVPEGSYLVLGDNRPYATDSRHYGFVRESQIVGKVKMKLWPLGYV